MARRAGRAYGAPREVAWVLGCRHQDDHDQHQRRERRYAKSRPNSPCSYRKRFWVGVGHAVVARDSALMILLQFGRCDRSKQQGHAQQVGSLFRAKPRYFLREDLNDPRMDPRITIGASAAERHRRALAIDASTRESCSVSSQTTTLPLSKHSRARLEED